MIEAVIRVDVEALVRAAIVAEARSWLGTPYHHMARVKGAGVDCGQLLAAVYENAGVTPHVEPESYFPDFMMHRDEERFLGYVERYARQVFNLEPLPGDVALFRFGRVISHGAIVIAWPEVIHAYIDTGDVTLDNIETNLRLRDRFVGIWTVFGGIA